jgi:hypothetical protein
VAALNRAGIGPLEAELTGAALRRAGLRGLEEALRRLSVSAAYAVFGHTHRAGPLVGDEAAEWHTRSGTALVNSGCWVADPRFAGPEHPHSPYRPGFAIWLGATGPPEPVNLLD